MSPNTSQFEKNVVEVGSLTVYEVKEEELEILKQGPNQRHGRLFDVAILFLGVFISNTISLKTGLGSTDGKKLVIMRSISICALLVGLITLALWIFIKKENTFEQVCNKIVNR